MSEVSTPTGLAFGLANYGSNLIPHFQIPQYTPIPLPKPFVPDIGAAVNTAIGNYDKERAYNDGASARAAADFTNRAYLAAHGGSEALANLPGGSTTPDPNSPEASGDWSNPPGNIFSRAVNSVKNIFGGGSNDTPNGQVDPSTGAREMTPPTDAQVTRSNPTGAAPLANLASAFDSDHGNFQAGPNGASFVPYRRDPAQDAHMEELTRGLRQTNDERENYLRRVNAGPSFQRDPITGQVVPIGGNSASTPPGGSLPAADPTDGTPNPLFPAGARTETVRTTTFGGPNERQPDADTQAGRSATGALIPPAAGVAGTVAVDPARYPYGTIFKFPDGSTRVAGDTGSAVVAQTASGGRAPVVDVYKDEKQPDWQNVTVIPPLTDNYAKLSQEQKLAYHRRAASLNVAGGDNAPAPADAPRSVAAFAPKPLTLSPDPPASAVAANGFNLPLTDFRPLAAPSLQLMPDPGPAVGSSGVPLSRLTLTPASEPAINTNAFANLVGESAAASAPLRLPLLSTPTASSPAAPAIDPLAPRILDPKIYGMQRGFVRNGTFTPAEDGDTLQPYVKPPVVGDAVVDPATGQPVPGALMIGNQFVTRPPQPGKPGSVPLSLDGLTTEQQVQARALAKEMFGAYAGRQPEAVNTVAALLREGQSREDIRGAVGQINPALAVAGKYTADGQVKTYLNTVANYQTVKDIADKPQDKVSKQDDLSLLFAYVKADNPTMGVTEGAFKTAAAAGTFGDDMQRLVNQLTNTNQTLTPQQRDGYKNAALSKLIGQRVTYDLARQRYAGMAEMVGADPDVILGADIKPFTEAESRHARGLPESAGAAAVSNVQASVRVDSQADYDRLPSGTVYVDSHGKTARKP